MTQRGENEKALKARYAAQMMAAIAVLAETAPDDFRRRVIGRSLFVYCHEFIGWARKAKNGLRGQADQRARLRRLEALLAQLAKSDWGPYEAIRHRVAAHRQPLAPAAGDEAWTDINEVSLRVLAEDARAIWNELAAAYSMPALTDYPPVSDALRQRIAEDGYAQTVPGLLAGLGSFDATRPDAVAVIQGGALGDILRRCVDSIRALEVLIELFSAVNGSEPFAMPVAAAAHAEVITLYDLLLAAPPDTLGPHYAPSLLEHLRSEDRASPALATLEQAQAEFPEAELERIRTIRNRVAAHIDDSLPLRDLLDLLEGYRADDVNAVIQALAAAITDAANADILLRPLLLTNSRMDGLSRVDPPEHGAPFSA